MRQDKTFSSREPMQTTTYRVKLESMPGSEYMAGAAYKSEKGPNETYDQFEKRCWQEKINTDKDGNVVLNRFSIKNAIESAARRLKRKIPGEGKSTYTKLFEQGLIPLANPLLLKADGKPYKPSDFEARSLHVPSDGKKGSSTRVWRIFPTVQTWMCEFSFLLIDPKITDSILKDHITEAGIFIGMGAMRAENSGINGRFLVQTISKQ